MPSISACDRYNWPSLQTVFSVLVGSAMLIFFSRPIYDIFFRERVEGRRYIRVGEKPALTPSESR